jgi:hypothetical protein
LTLNTIMQSLIGNISTWFLGNQSDVKNNDDLKPEIMNLKTYLSELKPAVVANSEEGTNNCGWSDLNVLLKLPRDYYVMNRKVHKIHPEYITTLIDDGVSRSFYPIRLTRSSDLTGDFKVEICHRVPKTTVDIVRNFEGRSPIKALYLSNGRHLFEIPSNVEDSWVSRSSICYQEIYLMIELTPEYLQNQQYSDDYIKFGVTEATFHDEHRKKILCSPQYLFGNVNHIIKSGEAIKLNQTQSSKMTNHAVKYLIINHLNRPIVNSFVVPRSWDFVTKISVHRPSGEPIAFDFTIGGNAVSLPTVDQKLSLENLKYHEVIINFCHQTDYKGNYEIQIEGRDSTPEELSQTDQICTYHGNVISGGILTMSAKK